MRIAIVSDIHANLAAFEAVLAQAKSVGYDAMVCLGDVIGYGPDPVECIDLVRQHCEWTLLGNHDFAAVYEPTHFNPAARDAAFWTRDETVGGAFLMRELARIDGARKSGALAPAAADAAVAKAHGDQKDRIDFMFRIAPRQIMLDRYVCVHGSPAKPVNEYLFPNEVDQNSYRLERSFRMLTIETKPGTEVRASAIVGHTHTPGYFLEESEGLYEWCAFSRGLMEWTPSKDEMPPGLRFILNPGSVGQPRDGDPRASFAILETSDATSDAADGATPDRFTFHRVEYDIARTQEKLRVLRESGAKLDQWLADRLALGQ
ncbi:MAG: metallophosphoesterase family protein [Planctomycetota bacterium]